jgi:hypothetical protein
MTQEESIQRRLKVVVIDERNGPVRKDGSNLTVPEEGRLAILGLIAQMMGDPEGIVIRVDNGGVFVAAGVGQVSLVATKSEEVMNAEKATRELDHRTATPRNDLEAGEHPVETKFARVWHEGWTTEQKPLRGV